MGKFRAIMPHKMTITFKKVDEIEKFTEELAIGIKGLTNAQLAKGVEGVRNNCEWPPSVAEFKRLCNIDDWQHAGQAVIFNPDQLRIGTIKATPETVKREKEIMMKKLKT